MDATAALILFSAICAAVAIIAGLAVPRAWVWNWADAVYYPIAIVGVVFLFISNERSRSLDALQRDVGEAERRVIDQEKAKPEFNARNFQPVFLDSSYGLLKSEIDLGDACARIPDVTIKCITAKRHAEIAHSVFDGFNIPKTLAEDTSTAETIKDFCDRGYRFIDALQTNVPIDNSVYGALKASFADLAKRNLTPADVGTTEEARDAFDAAQSREAETVLRLVTGESAKLIREYYENERQYATNLFSSLSMCLRIPGADRQNLGRFEQWASEGAKAKGDLNTLTANIKALKDSPPELSTWEKSIKFILNNLWSFILVAALSLKFARGLSQLRRPPPPAPAAQA
jgi:hypothetical protein